MALAETKEIYIWQQRSKESWLNSLKAKFANQKQCNLICKKCIEENERILLDLEMKMKCERIEKRVSENYGKTNAIFFIKAKSNTFKPICRFVNELEIHLNENNARMTNLNALMELAKTKKIISSETLQECTDDNEKELEKSSTLIGPLGIFKCVKCNDKGFLMGAPMTTTAATSTR